MCVICITVCINIHNTQCIQAKSNCFVQPIMSQGSTETKLLIAHPPKKLSKFRESPAGDPALPSGKHNHVFLDADDIPVMS